MTAAVATAALVGAVPANAQAERHCVLDSETGAQHCFADYQQVLSYASRGTQRSEVATQSNGDVVQGTFFDGPDYTGSSLTITGPELCKKDGWVNWQFDLGDDWKNKITSVQPWGDCWIWLYPEPNLGGDRDGPFKENNGNIGSYMDNRTQSIGFS
ncbi:hypothetical protein VA596_44800 [Amycolatopsis sp., V23-08]|uniref:Uncharacterized protein n=1 Tax=Amycolatopsis heterodermiae TaxID=3110235 RepID=A0ABU5RKA3_9PSEU|nr:hypothetical protein [Amycolatopsis sp., V23-08]MEA5366717.1 hypothetical protein [Amycolatopsis sp., V23-08]